MEKKEARIEEAVQKNCNAVECLIEKLTGRKLGIFIVKPQFQKAVHP